MSLRKPGSPLTSLWCTKETWRNSRLVTIEFHLFCTNPLIYDIGYHLLDPVDAYLGAKIKSTRTHVIGSNFVGHGYRQTHKRSQKSTTANLSNLSTETKWSKAYFCWRSYVYCMMAWEVLIQRKLRPVISKIMAVANDCHQSGRLRCADVKTTTQTPTVIVHSQKQNIACSGQNEKVRMKWLIFCRWHCKMGFLKRNACILIQSLFEWVHLIMKW